MPRWLWLAFGGGVLVFAGGSLLLLRAYLQPAFDLGIYDQSLWLVLRGESFNTVGGGHVLGAHFSPILWILAPISLIPGGAIPELVLQSVLLASVVFPAHHLASHFERDPRPYVAVALVHPGLFSGAWYGFRPWNLAAPLLAWGMWWLVRSPTWRRLLFLGVAALLIREDIALWVAMGGLLLVLTHRMKLTTWLWPATAMGAASVLVAWWVLPSYSPVDGYYFTSAEVRTDDPIDWTLIAGSSLARVLFLWVPLGVSISAFRWRVAAPLLVPVVGLALLGGNATVTAYHYDMLFVPLLLLVLAGSSGQPSIATVILGSTLIAFTLGVLRPVGPKYGPNPWEVSSTAIEHLDSVRGIVARLDDDRSLRMSLPDPLMVHFTERKQISVFPYPFDAVPLGPIAFFCPEPDVVVSDGRFEGERPNWDEAVDSGRYRSVSRIENYEVFVREAPALDKPCAAGAS